MENLNFCIFGDSVGKGVVLSDTGRYASGSPDINSLTGRDDITLKNYSRFGFVTEKTLWLIEKCGDEIASSDAVFIEVGGNDCDFDWKAVAQNPEGEFDPKTPPEEFCALYADLVRGLQKRGVTVALMTLPPIDAERYLHWVASGEQERKNILRWLGDVQRIYRFQEMYSGLVARVAAETGALLADVRTSFLQRRDTGALLCGDGIHPNAAGHQLLFDTLCDFGERHLCRLKG